MKEVYLVCYMSYGQLTPVRVFLSKNKAEHCKELLGTSLKSKAMYYLVLKLEADFEENYVPSQSTT